MLVAGPVSKTQRKQLPKAQAACDKEWDKLLKRTTWDPTSVKAWSWVSHISKTAGVKAHGAKIVEICVVEGAELEDQDLGNVFKGRAALDGSWVKGESYDVVFFYRIGSSPLACKPVRLLTSSGYSPNLISNKLTWKRIHTMRLAGNCNMGPVTG